MAIIKQAPSNIIFQNQGFHAVFKQNVTRSLQMGKRFRSLQTQAGEDIFSIGISGSKFRVIAVRDLLAHRSMFIPLSRNAIAFHHPIRRLQIRNHHGIFRNNINALVGRQLLQHAIQIKGLPDFLFYIERQQQRIINIRIVDADLCVFGRKELIRQLLVNVYDAGFQCHHINAGDKCVLAAIYKRECAVIAHMEHIGCTQGLRLAVFENVFAV